jgi:hypothetical protein
VSWRGGIARTSQPPFQRGLKERKGPSADSAWGLGYDRLWYESPISTAFHSISACFEADFGSEGRGAPRQEVASLPSVGPGWPVALGVLGLTYGITLAPTLRFLVPYLLIVPALALVWAVHRLGIPTHAGVFRRAGKFTSVVFVVPALMLLALFALPTTILNVRSAVRGSLGNAVLLEDVRWLVPHEIRLDPSLAVRWSGDVRYVVPVETSQCGGAPLPCTPRLTYPDIKLRSPDRGLASGFVRSGGSIDARE